MSGTNHNHHHHSCGCKACSASQGSVFTSHEEPCCSHSHEHESDSEEKHHHSHSHDHSHGEEKQNYKWLILSLLLFAAGVVSSIFNAPIYVLIPIYALSALAAGHEIFLEGVKTIVKLKIDETTLLTIAVIAAFCIGEYPEAAIVTILFEIGEILEAKAVARSRKNIAKLSNIRPDTAVVIKNGKETTVAAEEVLTGTEIIVKPHNRIPLDGIITEGFTTLDSSAITGESIPVSGEKGTGSEKSGPRCRREKY